MAAAFPLVFSAVYLWQALVLPDAVHAAVSPRAFPIGTGVFMVAAAGYMLIDHLRDRWRGTRTDLSDDQADVAESWGDVADGSNAAGEEIRGEDDTAHNAEQRGAARRAAVTFFGGVTVTIMAFLLLFETVGVVFAVFILLAGVSTLAAPSRWKRNLVVAAAFAVACDWVFRVALNVNLPTGWW